MLFREEIQKERAKKEKGKGVRNMDYGGKYLKIRKAVHEAGFDEFYQAGSVSRFHKMNIVAESKALGLAFWFCIGGGYGVADEYYIITRKLGTDGPDERTVCKNQQEMADRIKAIGRQIEAVKGGNANVGEGKSV